jgi:sarcosine oxidase subunit alpha
MNGAPFRLPEGGQIDRTEPLSFTFAGRRLAGFGGDTLASALLANGVRLVGRSFKYHRPRGIYSAGPEEPSALVRLRAGSRAEPNTRATMIELYDGLEADPQNAWPSVDFDLGAINGVLSPLIPAGFYYKTFMWPANAWESVYEKVIRRAAGMGTAPRGPDPDRYEHRHAHCDVLVVGGGPTGLAAALAAGASGARVILVDESAGFGGALKRERLSIEGRPAQDWAAAAIAELEGMREVVLLPRTTAFGYYDHNMVVLAERVADHLPEPPPHLPRQRLWWVRAKRVVLATGAIERPLVFGDNDRPGVMLAASARAYANQFAVRAGSCAVVFTNNDDAYRSAFDLADAGVNVAAVIDTRESASAVAGRAKARGIEVLAGSVVVSALGRKAVGGVEVARADGTGRRRIACDLVACSGGWSPTIHLHSQSGGKAVWQDDIAAFVPGASRQAERSAGAARGLFRLGDCLADGFRAGAEAARAAGIREIAMPSPPAVADEAEEAIAPQWDLPQPARGKGKRFVDIQDDVTADDIALAKRENYASVEHLKRYTTLGMGTDQGKTSNVNGLAIMAELRNQAIPAVGTTTFRPPYTPVTLGLLAGRHIGRHFTPTRRSAMHDWHAAQGAVFVEAGLWLRPRYYPRSGESMRDAIAREVRAVREGVGLVDVSTLGKIEIQGPDAAEFLNRLYINGFAKLPVGRARYGVMLREDGIVFDDGTTSRLGEMRYLMTTTTGNAVKVMQHIDYYLQVVWPDLRVHAVSVTEQWSAMALAGPKSRAVLARVMDEMDVSDAALPHMGVAEGRLAGIPARVFRLSFSGERAYEINVPADWGRAAWEAVIAAGEADGIVPYGTEAMGVMRIEKGHVAGPELDGRTTPFDLGLGRLVSSRKDFIGRRLLQRPALTEPNRKSLVGLIPVDGATPLRGGSQIVEDPHAPPPVKMVGHVTSAVWSPTLRKPIALALVAGGAERQGETLHSVSPLTGEAVAVTVVGSVFLDPDGSRLHG